MTHDERMKAFTQIAYNCFRMETLTVRKSDSLDFKEVAVWDVVNALQTAYDLGYENALKKAREFKN